MMSQNSTQVTHAGAIQPVEPISADSTKSIIKPVVRGFICLTAHPEGCYKNVEEQVALVRKLPAIRHAPSRVLVIGSSTGYGLASRIVSAFAGQAGSIGVYFEKEPEGHRPATAGWYNSAAFRDLAGKSGLYAEDVNGDAFSDEIKEKTIDVIRKGFGQVDLVIYSLASPRRKHPRTGLLHSSVIKTTGQPYTAKTLDTDREVVKDITVEAAGGKDIEDTVAVMGGEDWEMWIDALDKAGVLAESATTVAYSYVGPEITWPVYRDGTIGLAKHDLEEAARRLDGKLKATGGRALISVNQAVITQSSSAIPMVPLYMSILFRILKGKRQMESCVEQIYRLFASRLFAESYPELDERLRTRIDEHEMSGDVQDAVREIWPQVTTENLKQLTDFEDYKKGFLKLFGFGLPDIDYEKPTDINPFTSPEMT